MSGKAVSGEAVSDNAVPGNAGRWRELPAAPPPHGTFLAWYHGCRCEQCEPAGQEFARELARRNAWRQDRGAVPEARLSADDRAHLDPAVRARGCPFCGALRNHRCRDPHFPLHFAATHSERSSA